MQTNSFFQRTILAVVLAAVASCADAPTRPASDTPDLGAPAPIIGVILDAPDTVVALQRLQPLPSAITVSRKIGLFGGSLAIPAAGVSVYFPPGAMLRSTTVTMTAPAGSTVAYEFGPHGMRFLVPPVITQKLDGVGMTGISGSDLFAAYFADLSSINLATGVGLVTELLNVTLAGSRSASFPVDHFSGYLIASGYARESSMTLPGAQ